MTGLNTDGRGLTVSGRGVQAGAVTAGVTEEVVYETETDWADAVDRPGFVYDEIADHAGGEAGVAANGYYHGSLVRGLVAYYPLDDSSTGSTAVDATELGNDGTINGATYAGSGQVGSDSLSFDGTDDYVSIPYNANSSVSNITVSAWIRTNNVTTSQNIIGSRNSSTGNEFNLQINNDTLRFFTYDGSTIHGITNGGTVTTGTWYHVTAIYHTSNGYKIYLDGSLSGSASTTTFATGSLDEDIGLRSDGSYPFDGEIDDVRLYDRALSPPEIAALSSRTETSPVPTEATL